MNYLQTLWGKLSPKWQEEITSAWHTFFTASVIEIGVQWSANQATFSTGAISKELLIAIGAAVLRSGVKAVFSMVYASVKAGQSQPLP